MEPMAFTLSCIPGLFTHFLLLLFVQGVSLSCALAQAEFNLLQTPPASASSVLRLQAGTAMAGLE